MLDIYFINSLHLGVFGAGLATVIAQGVSAILCIGYMLKKYEILRFAIKDMKQDASLTKELLAAGCSMAFMSSLVQFGTLMLQTAINGLGQNIIVAHTAARKVTEIFMMAFSITGTENAEVLVTGATYLKFDTAFYMVASCVTLFRNVLQGLGNHITPIVSSFVELVGKVVFAKLMVPRFGYWGVILAEPVVWILMVIPLVVMLLKSPYLKRKLNNVQ